MTRLRVEANKIKEVLSANLEYPVKFEQLHSDTDLVTKVTRTNFEESCSDLYARLTLPIDAALKKANISMSELDAIELLGGSVRMPKVKSLLESYFKPANLELGQHLNGDEAMALGAAFRAANLSTAFRVRKVGFSDIMSFGVSIGLETLPSVDNDSPENGFLGGLLGKKTVVSTGVDTEIPVWTKRAEIYEAGSTFTSKTKLVVFPYDKDILCKISYSEGSDLPPGTSSMLAVYNITGVANFAKEIALMKNASAPKVHLSFSLDSDGVASLIKAEVSSEIIVEESVAEEGSNIKTSGDDISSEINETADTEKEEVNTDTTESEKSSGNEPTASKTGDDSFESSETGKMKKGKKDKDVKKDKKPSALRRTLTITEDLRAVQPVVWSSAMIRESAARLHALTAADNARKAKEAALNDLEAYIYKVKNKISDEEEQLVIVSTEEQRQQVVDLANAAEEWIYDDGRYADVIVYSEKHKELKKLAEAIFHRHSELVDRPAAVTKAQSVLAEIRLKAASWPEKMPHITAKEIDSLLDAVIKAELWLEAKQEAQLGRTAFEDPVFDSSDVPAQLKPVGVLFDRLSRKPKPPPEKVKSAGNGTNSSNSSNASEPLEKNVDDQPSEPQNDEDLKSTETLEAETDTAADKYTPAGDEF